MTTIRKKRVNTKSKTNETVNKSTDIKPIIEKNIGNKLIDDKIEIHEPKPELDDEQFKDTIPKDLVIIKKMGGHIQKRGINIGKLTNFIWLVEQVNNNIQFYLMHCRTTGKNDNNYVYFSKQSYNIVVKAGNTFNNWSIVINTGCNTITALTNNSKLTLHIIILKSIDGKGTIKYIPDNIYDCRIDSLLIKEEGTNTKKRDPSNKKKPDGFVGDVPIYMSYHREKIGTPEFFDNWVIEKHPNLLPGKQWIGSKSKDIGILKRYEAAKKAWDILEAAGEGKLYTNAELNILINK
jgi:hypothetical protein